MEMQRVYCEVGTQFLCIINIDTKLSCLNACCLNVAATVLYSFVQSTQYTTVINLHFLGKIVSCWWHHASVHLAVCQVLN